MTPPWRTALTCALALVAAAIVAAAAGSSFRRGAPPALPCLPGTEARASSPRADLPALHADLERIVRQAGGPAERSGVLVASLDRGDTLFSLNADVPLAPASTMKLYSTGAALCYLGPGFRFSTALYADGPIANGTLRGDLVLYGTGDPTLSGRMLESATAPFGAFADSLLALDVRRITGNVVGDGSYLDQQWLAEGWEASDLMEWYGVPVSALNFAENMVTLRVRPGGAGEPARITSTPRTKGLSVVNRVRTVSSGGTSVRFEHGTTGIVVTGQIRRGDAAIARALPVVDPANYAAAALAAYLETRGIEVEGEVRGVGRNSDSKIGGDGSRASSRPRLLAVHRSPPLVQIAAVTNHVSHNLFADALLKRVGREVGGEASFAAGSRAIARLLDGESAALSPAPRIMDGSGLSRSNRVTARATVQLLGYMARGTAWDAYYASLPTAGEPGGLPRMRGTPAAGNLRAKTGTLESVSALSGYVRSADGERLVFSVIFNGVPSATRAKEVEDQIGARLARFRRSAAEPGRRLGPPGPPVAGRLNHVARGGVMLRSGAPSQTIVRARLDRGRYSRRIVRAVITRDVS